MNQRSDHLARTHARKRVLAGAMASAVALMLAGCVAALPEQNQQSPDEAHLAVRDTMESTIENLGGPDGWSAFEDRSAHECQVGGVEGVAYKEIQHGPGVASTAERDEVVEQVREHLESLGMKTWLAERTEANPMVIVDAKGGPTEKFSVYVDTEQISVQGISWCVPGDWQKLLHEEQGSSDG
jgi:hypothetical protein